jgi:hypothetical protein
VSAVTVTLPPIVDDQGTTHRLIATIQLTAAQSRKIVDGASGIVASEFAITANGLVFTFSRGIFSFLPERYQDTVASLGLKLPLVGSQAVAALKAIELGMHSHRRRRGERGPSLSTQRMSDELLSDVLVRISHGSSWRVAVAACLDAHSTKYLDLPDADALYQRLKRHLRKR